MLLGSGLGAPFASAESLSAWSGFATFIVATFALGITAVAAVVTARQFRLEALPVIVVEHGLDPVVPTEGSRVIYLILGPAFRKPHLVSFRETTEKPGSDEEPGSWLLCRFRNVGRTASIDTKIHCGVVGKTFNYFAELGILAPGSDAFIAMNANAIDELETVLLFTRAECVSVFGSRRDLRLFGNTTVSMFNEAKLASSTERKSY